MDLEVEIKEEPVWLEEKDNSSLEKFEFVSEMKPLKQETKSELRESVPTQDNALEPSPDIKEEISIEQNTVDEFVPHIEEENNVAEIDVFTVHSENGGNGSAVCGRSFTNEFSVSRHTVLAHSADVQPQCTVCDLTFTDRTSSHGQTFNRTQGGSQVSKGRSDGLTQSVCRHVHTLTHNRARPYACTVCGRRFTTEYSLRTHMVAHTGERPYRCTECNRSFNKLYNVRRHMVTHTGDKLYFCTECNHTCRTRDNLRSHVLYHSGGRPLTCIECDRRFSLPSSFRRHMETHTAEKPHSSEIVTVDLDC